MVVSHGLWPGTLNKTDLRTVLLVVFKKRFGKFKKICRKTHFSVFNVNLHVSIAYKLIKICSQIFRECNSEKVMLLKLIRETNKRFKISNFIGKETEQDFLFISSKQLF